MKVGLLTLPISDNYGGILQCIALYKHIEAQGHDVVLLYKEHDAPFLKSVVKKILSAIPLQDYKNIRSNYKKKLLHLPFINSCIINRSVSLKSTKDLFDATKQYQLDAVVVGSDQVWRLKYIKDSHYKSYFLDFADDTVKKIAYAASFGKDYWEGKGDEVEIGNLLERFDYISVREKSGVDICKKVFGVKKPVHHVLDPTMLWSKDFYMNLMPSSSFKTKISLLTYVLDEAEDKSNVISACVQKKGIDPEYIMHLKSFGDKGIFYSVPEWLEAFSKADFIITDSFHGVVFSIIFNKQFVAIGNKDRGLDRFISLFEFFEIKDRLVIGSDFNIDCFNSEIEYEHINKKLAEQQQKCSDFLRAL